MWNELVMAKKRHGKLLDLLKFNKQDHSGKLKTSWLKLPDVFFAVHDGRMRAKQR